MTQKTTAQDGLSTSSPLINVKLDPQHFIEKLRQLHAWQQQQQESLLRQQQEKMALLKRKQSASSVSLLGPLNTQTARTEVGGPGLGVATGKENIPVRLHNATDSIKGRPSPSRSSPTHTAITTTVPEKAAVVVVPERRSPMSLPESLSICSGSIGGGDSHSPVPPETEGDAQGTPTYTDDRPLHSALGNYVPKRLTCTCAYTQPHPHTHAHIHTRTYSFQLYT